MEINNLKLENKRLRLELEETNKMQKELSRELQSRLVNDYEELKSMTFSFFSEVTLFR